MSRLMVSISGIRGIVGEGLTPAVALEFAQAFGTWCEGKAVVVGRDPRVSGDMMHHAVLSGLISVGVDVIDIGVATTPTTQMATEKFDVAGGLMLTASHNPIMWNGIKMLADDGLFLDGEQGQKIIDIKNAGNYAFKPWQKLGKVTQYNDAAADHLEAVLNLPFISREQIRARKFKVVADCINGAGCVIVPKLLQELGCEMVVLNGTADGHFARTPEPLPENLGAVAETVQQVGADLAVVVDPDSDRMALLSEEGKPLGEEYTLALAADFFLRNNRGKVVVNVSTSRAIDDIAARYECEVERTRVGEINVAKRMREVGAVFGGEGNGGVILPDVHLGRDAIVAIAMTLQRLSESAEKLSTIHATLPQYTMVKAKINLEADSNPAAVIAALQQKYQNEQQDLTDGLKILRNRSWVQVRPSNTEPIIRIMAEAPTLHEAQALAEELMGATRAAGPN